MRGPDALSAAPGVHAGRDGWLFWVGARGEVSALYRDTIATRWLVWRWSRLIERRARRSALLGAEFRQMVMPDKLSVLDAKVGAPPLDHALSVGRRIARRLDPALAGRVWIDLFSSLAKAGDDVTALFPRADTHLTGRGYLAAYRAICASCGTAPARSVEEGGGADISLPGDLGSKLQPPAVETYQRHAFQPRARRVDVNALARLRESRPMEQWAGLLKGSRVVYRIDTAEADPRCVVLFGDSYAFMDGGLAPMLAETFRELHVIWSADIDWRYVEAVRPAIVIQEIAERFLRRVPRDRWRVELFAAARVRNAATT